MHADDFFFKQMIQIFKRGKDRNERKTGVYDNPPTSIFFQYLPNHLTFVYLCNLCFPHKNLFLHITLPIVRVATIPFNTTNKINLSKYNLMAANSKYFIPNHYPNILN